MMSPDAWETIFEYQADLVVRCWVEGLRWRLGFMRVVSQA